MAFLVFWLVGKEGMEKEMETIKMVHIGLL